MYIFQMINLPFQRHIRRFTMSCVSARHVVSFIWYSKIFLAVPFNNIFHDCLGCYFLLYLPGSTTPLSMFCLSQFFFLFSNVICHHGLQRHCIIGLWGRVGHYIIMTYSFIHVYAHEILHLPCRCCLVCVLWYCC